METKKARELQEELEATGWPPARIKMELKATAGARHEARVRATLIEGADELGFVLARGFCLEEIELEAEPENLRKLQALLLLEVGGVGGEWGFMGHVELGQWGLRPALGGGATDRLLQLGKCRWHASDGEAYHAAAVEALRAVEAALYRLELPAPTPEEILAAATATSIRMAPVWACSYALRQVRVAPSPDVAAAWEKAAREAFELVPEDCDWRNRLVRWL